MQKIIILVALMTYVTGIFAQTFSSQLEAKAKKGDVNAQYDLAVCYQKGLGITVNNKMAFTWFKKAAEKGSRYAQFNLGECYLKAIGTPVNEHLAFHWYQNALKNGNKDALPMLGLCYYAGKGAKIDYKKAVVYFRQSADAGSSLGKTCLGWCYAVNAGVDSADVNKAFSLWSDASVSESIKPIVSYLVGMFYLYSSQYCDLESAYGFLSSAANAPEPIGDAMQKTAYMEENGIGTSKNTVNAALLSRDYLKHNFTNEVGALLTEPLDYTSIPFQTQSMEGEQSVTANVSMGAFIVQNGSVLKAVPDNTDKSKNDDTKVYEMVDQLPSFPLGVTVLMNWLGINIHYPVEAQEKRIEGRVIVQFIVARDGSINDVNVVKSVDPLLDAEAVRVVRTMPKWNPGKVIDKNGTIKPANCKFTLPITFRLQ